MKKSLLLALAAVLTVPAFADPALTFKAGDAVQASYAVGSGTLTVTDTRGRMSIDANTAAFGTADDYVTLTARLKSAAKSDNGTNGLTFTAAEAGYLSVYVRTASNSAHNRNLVLTQAGGTLYDKVVDEADATTAGDTKVYPVITVEVAAGDIDITYPTGALNFYAFDFSTTDPNAGKTPEEQEPTGETESYRVGYYDAETNEAILGDEWTTAADPQQPSVVTVNTPSMIMTAVSGPVTHNVKVDEALGQNDTPAYITYYDNSWATEKKNDYANAKGEVEAWAFAKGQGNPVVAIRDSIYWQDDKGRWAYGAVYDYYNPDGSKGLPLNGSYFKFTPKSNGRLAAFLFVLKNGRPFYIVEESTKAALDTTQYYFEGCANNQKYNLEETDPDYERLNGVLKYQRLYHGRDFTVEDVTDEADPSVVVRRDTIWGAPNYQIWHRDQWARQNIWAWVFVNVKAGETYWMFNGTTQLGLGGFDFTPDAPAAIESVASDRQPARASEAAYDLRGQLAPTLRPGQLYIRGGKKVIIR